MLADIDRRLSHSTEEIEKQTKLTNGRVTKLEATKNMAMGGLILTNVILLPVALILFTAYINKR